MPRQRQPARLWLRPRRANRPSVWIIIHDRRQVSTGCGARDHGGAEAKLEAYLAQQRIEAALPSAAPANKTFIADVLRHYVVQRGDEVARANELASRLDRLLEWWGDQTLAAVNAANCKAYAKSRTTASAARRELEDLRAAINLAIEEGVGRDAVKVNLPNKPKS